jgi:hypothetical protein
MMEEWIGTPADGVAGRIWLRHFLPEWRADEGRTWTVHGLEGRVLGRVETPPGFRVTHVTPEHVVGVERDALDVEYVVVYAPE